MPEMAGNIYAPPGAIIPKTKFKLKIAKIRGRVSRNALFRK